MTSIIIDGTRNLDEMKSKLRFELPHIPLKDMAPYRNIPDINKLIMMHMIKLLMDMVLKTILIFWFTRDRLVEDL